MSSKGDEPVDAPRILVVEDDETLRMALVGVLSREGFLVCAATTGSEARERVEGFRPDAAILDIGLPGAETGFDVGRWLKQRSDLGVLFLTAADALEDRLTGFEIGADDYLVKPFAMPELVARLKAVLRRSGRLVSAIMQIRDLTIDESTRTAARGGVDLSLTPIEFEILAVLARNAGSVLSKRQLLALVWGFADFDSNLVEVHISAVRRKLEAHGPRLIHTARNAGYVLRP